MIYVWGRQYLARTTDPLNNQFFTGRVAARRRLAALQTSVWHLKHMEPHAIRILRHLRGRRPRPLARGEIR